MLGIETSADDTCAALLRVEGKGAEDRVAYSICDDRVSCANTQHRGIHPYDAVVSHTQQYVLCPLLPNHEDMCAHFLS